MKIKIKILFSKEDRVYPIQGHRFALAYRKNYIIFLYNLCFSLGKGLKMKKTKMLKKNYEFKNVLNRGKFYSGKYIVVFIKKNNKKNINCLGIAISSKLGKAVKRNYVKRIIRENYSKVEEHLKTGYDMVFLWKKRKDIGQASYQHMEIDIKKIFKDAKMFLEE